MCKLSIFGTALLLCNGIACMDNADFKTSLDRKYCVTVDKEKKLLCVLDLQSDTQKKFKLDNVQDIKIDFICDSKYALVTEKKDALWAIRLIQLDPMGLVVNETCRFHNYYEDSGLFYCDYQQNDDYFPFLYDLKKKRVLVNHKNIASWCSYKKRRFLTVLITKGVVNCFDLHTGKRQVIEKQDGNKIIDYTIRNGNLDVRYSNGNMTSYKLESSTFNFINLQIKKYDSSDEYAVALWNNTTVRVKRKSDCWVVLNFSGVEDFKFDRERNLLAVLCFDKSLRVFDLEDTNNVAKKVHDESYVDSFNLVDGYLFAKLNNKSVVEGKTALYYLKGEEVRRIEKSCLGIDDTFVIENMKLKLHDNANYLVVFCGSKNKRRKGKITKVFSLELHGNPLFLFERKNISFVNPEGKRRLFMLRSEDGSREVVGFVDGKAKTLVKTEGYPAILSHNPKTKRLAVHFFNNETKRRVSHVVINNCEALQRVAKRKRNEREIFPGEIEKQKRRKLEE